MSSAYDAQEDALTFHWPQDELVEPKLTQNEYVKLYPVASSSERHGTHPMILIQ